MKQYLKLNPILTSLKLYKNKYLFHFREYYKTEIFNKFTTHLILLNTQKSLQNIFLRYIKNY